MKPALLMTAFSMLILSMTAALAQEMPTSLAQAESMEKANRLPLTDFYSTPANLAASKPGALLRSEAFKGYTLPKGASAVRILYHSQDANGHDVATSAVVLIPAGQPPATGWPVIAWAHGTSGVSRLCAPSAMKDLYYGEEGLLPMVRAGFAVVATDYHGLGTEGPHQYVNKIAQARDVIYSIPAAHAAVPNLDRRWVVDGHSQGGLAAWSVAEMQHDLKDPDYLGAVSVAGVARGIEFFGHLAATPGVGFYLAFMAAGVHASYPDFQPRELVSDEVLAHYEDVTTKGCYFRAYATYAKLPGDKLLRKGWEHSTRVKDFFDSLALARKPIGGPMLVLAGEADQTVPIDGVRDAVKKMCAMKQPVSFKSYPGLDHDPVMYQSTPYQLDWIRARFAGKPAASSCD